MPVLIEGGLRRGQDVELEAVGSGERRTGTVFDYARNYSSVRVEVEGGEILRFATSRWIVRLREGGG